MPIDFTVSYNDWRDSLFVIHIFISCAGKWVNYWPNYLQLFPEIYPYFHQFHHSVLRQMINKYEAKRNHLIASLDGPVRPEESLDVIKNGVTVDSLARAFIRAAHVQTRGDA
jgi:hypothetical protein